MKDGGPDSFPLFFCLVFEAYIVVVRRGIGGDSMGCAMAATPGAMMSSSFKRHK